MEVQKFNPPMKNLQTTKQAKQNQSVKFGQKGASTRNNRAFWQEVRPWVRLMHRSGDRLCDSVVLMAQNLQRRAQRWRKQRARKLSLTFLMVRQKGPAHCRPGQPVSASCCWTDLWSGTNSLWAQRNMGIKRDHGCGRNSKLTSFYCCVAVTLQISEFFHIMSENTAVTPPRPHPPAPYLILIFFLKPKPKRSRPKTTGPG